MRVESQVRVYRALLTCLPPGLRAEFGRDMEQLFADRLREANGSRTAVIRLWLAALVDLLSAASRVASVSPNTT